MNFIKIFNITPQKPEIIAMARRLHKSQNEVLGACVRFWCWVDEHTEAGDMELSMRGVDSVAGLRGLASAMVDCGWLKTDADGIMLLREPWGTSKSRRARCRANARAKKTRMSAEHESLACEIAENPELVEACEGTMEGEQA